MKIRNRWKYCHHQHKRLDNTDSGNCKLTIVKTNGPFLIIVCAWMKDAIVWKWWIWDPCWWKGQRSFYAKVLFSLALFLLYKHSLAAISLHFGYLPMQLVLCNYLVQTTKHHSATSSFTRGPICRMTKKDGRCTLPSMSSKSALKLRYCRLLLIMSLLLGLYWICTVCSKGNDMLCERKQNN